MAFCASRLITCTAIVMACKVSLVFDEELDLDNETPDEEFNEDEWLDTELSMSATPHVYASYPNTL